eukprot:8020498-Pyramimonas_sp.AAC.1
MFPPWGARFQHISNVPTVVDEPMKMADNVPLLLGWRRQWRLASRPQTSRLHRYRARVPLLIVPSKATVASELLLLLPPDLVTDAAVDKDQ